MSGKPIVRNDKKKGSFSPFLFPIPSFIATLFSSVGYTGSEYITGTIDDLLTTETTTNDMKFRWI